MAAPPPPPPPPFPHHPARIEGGTTIVSGPGPYEPPPVEFSVVCLNVVNTITQIVIGGVVFSVILFGNLFPFANSLSQHVYLCVIGYVLLMTQAVLSFNPHAGWSHNLRHPQKRTAHWILQILGAILAIAGSAVAISDMNGDNFQTAHGITGLIALILTVLSLLGGILNLCCGERMNTVLIRTLHAVLGSVTLIIAYTSLCIGFDDVYRLIVGDTNANLSIALTVIALVGTLLVVSINMYRRFNK